MELKFAQRAIIAGITQQSERDKQRNIGPSEIGGCPRCVGERLAEVLPEQYPDLPYTSSFGLGAWIGTAVHAYLEEQLNIPGSVTEQKNFIYELEGYGSIKGSTDLFVPPNVFDFKVAGKYNFDKMKLAWRQEPNKIPTTTYRVQQMLYGYGWELKGYKIDKVGLCVIPKLSNDPDDITFFMEKYNPAVAERALERLEKIWHYVQDNRLEELPCEPDCYVCTRVLWRA